MEGFSHDIANAIKPCLDNKEYCHVTFDQNRGIFSFCFHPDKGELKVINIQIAIGSDHYTVSILFPITICSDRPRIEYSLFDYVHLVNKKLGQEEKKKPLIGRFKADFEIDRLCYIFLEECKEQIPSSDRIQASIHNSINIFNYYASGFIDILYRDYTPLSAIDKCERRSKEAAQ